MQDFLPFGKLGLKRGNSHASGPRKILEHVPVGQEGIEARGLPEPNTRKFGAGEAIFHFAMLPAAPDDGAELEKYIHQVLPGDWVLLEPGTTLGDVICETLD